MNTPTTVDLSAYQPSLQIGAGRLKQIIWYIVNQLFFKSSIPYPAILKRKLLQLFGAQIGKGIVLKPCVNIKYPWKLCIGDYCWIGEQVWIDNLDNVSMGNHVCVSQGAMLLTGNHDYKKRHFNLKTGKINLEDGVWIGSNAVVCPGVNCGSHSVLTVASVASINLLPYHIYRGNPAEFVKIRVIE